MHRFRDRREAGRCLALELLVYRDEQPVVVALPRGGVPVAAEVAAALAASLDVIVVRKLGLPSQPELAMGALGEGGVRVLNDDVIRIARVTAGELAAVERREQVEVRRRADRYRPGRSMYPLGDRTVIVVDDGVATGSSARAAIEVARAHGARKVVLAAPVAPPDTVAELRAVADAVVTVATPTPFVAIAPWYEDFSQTSDDEVTALLADPTSGS